jgi:hypothetical protein
LENAFGGKSKIKDAEVDLIVTTCTISILSLNTGREKYLLHPKSFFFKKKNTIVSLTTEPRVNQVHVTTHGPPISGLLPFAEELLPISKGIKQNTKNSKCMQNNHSLHSHEIT